MRRSGGMVYTRALRARGLCPCGFDSHLRHRFNSTIIILEMDAYLENEQPKPEEVKNLNEKFHPFDPIGPSITIRLALPGWERADELPIGISTDWSRARNIDVITPFNPNEGYQITNEDFELNRRREKLKHLTKSPLNENIAPFYLDVRSYISPRGKLSSLLQEPENPFNNSIDPKIFPFLRRLRAQVFFPSSDKGIPMGDPNYHPASSFESKPSLLYLKTGTIKWEHFYPLDTGPLATNDPEEESVSATPAGLSLYLPRDSAKLMQIEMRFILLPEQKTDLPSNSDKASNDTSLKKGIPKAFWSAFEDDEKS